MINVVIAGDFCDNGRATPLIKNGKYADIFADVKPIIRSADYSLVNFEFPIVDEVLTPIVKCGPCLFGQKASIDAIKYAGFKCATLANNHILDQGETSCLSTKKLLEEAGVDTVGVGKNTKEASKALYKNINGETLAIINCCEHEFSIATEKNAGANALNPVQQYYAIKEAREKADYVLVVVHGGHEHYQLPSPRMKETYRFFIDAGADAVVNHHQHCYSGYEVYQGNPIFYGIGNFCFDWIGKRKEKWNEGYLVEISFSKGRISFDIHPYYQCDNCPRVSLLKENPETWNRKIEKLNAIIEDEGELCRCFDQFCSKRYRDTKLLFSPLRTRLFRGLTKYGFPYCISKQRLINIFNHIDCESHRDITVRNLMSDNNKI